MLFNRQGLQQKNWRMVKKGKHILFGCSLFFVVGGVNISGPQVTYASDVNGSETVAKQEKNSNIGEVNSNALTPTLEKEKQTQNSSNNVAEKITVIETVGSPTDKKEVDKKEVNKKELEDLVAKIKKTDISKKTEKSVKELNLILSRAEKALDNKEISQEEIDKEVKALKEAFDKLEDKPKEDKKSEATEKTESKIEEKSNVENNIKEKQQENTTRDVARKHNEKITKVTETVTEIHSIANQINYEFSDAEKELVKTAENLSTAHNSDKNNDETIQKLLKEVIYLRNKVANRMTRVHSGKRDPRNGKMIDGKDESRFRAISIVPTANKYDGKNTLTSEQKTELTYYNSDEVFSFFDVNGGKPVEDYVQRIGIIRGFENFPGLKLKLAYKGAPGGQVNIEGGSWSVNNPAVGAAIFGVIGSNRLVKPGTYDIVIGANGKRPELGSRNIATITYRYTIKPQSERNTVRDLTLTYVDDVRHLTDTERAALIEKFKLEHPTVVKRYTVQKNGKEEIITDFARAEVSADGATMTIHFKDGFSTKTIQTNAQNDVEAKHSSLTAYFGDSKELYTNPRELVRSKTGNEVPTTAQVTYKTPFNLQQVGTRNVVVTTTYENGVTKDVTTPYTVLDFVGKQDKKINQNQSGQLGDARNYITVSDNSALPGELTVRWKGGSSTVDTSAAGVQHKEIEILRGNHLMKTVTIPVEIVDNINPTITAPDSVLLTRLEGLPSEINISAQDNNKGVGLKDSNPITVENLPNPLFYNSRTSKIEINGVIPNNFQNGRSSIQVTVKAVDRKGNTAIKTITFNVQAQTDKYNAVPNSEKQTVSYGATPDAGTSVNKTNLPANTTYTWATTPSTTIGPGDKVGVVTVTYPDGSKDTVNVTIAVRKLSDEHDPTGTKIVRNQNAPVTNNDLKAAVTINNNGNSKVKSVTPVGTISTVNAGNQTIRAKVTYLDDTSDFVDIPLEVKDVTAPTIQTPNDRQNWDLIALDRTLPSITVTSVDNNGGTGIKSTTVTGLPDFLVYDNATKTIKFKNGVQEVTKLPVGQNSKTYNATIQVTDNANNPSQRQITITVKSMTTKYNATPNGQKQTVSYGTTPDAGTSVNKSGLPAGTRYTWATMPSTITGPGDKAGVVTVTYPDDSTDTVNVTVNVRALNGEYVPTATKITKNQNDSITNDELKAAVTISNNGNSKIKSVTPVGTISTAEFGNKTINATVTYLDDTTDPVTIPLEVRDVTKPIIQTPADRQNWDLIALDRILPEIKVTTTDNPGGSGIKSTTVTGLPNFLVYDEVTKTIKFKNGVQEVTKLPEGTDVQTHNITITVTDNSNNSNSVQVTIAVKSMTTKYDATANSEKQTVSYGEIPDAGTSINKTNLPAGTTYTWVTTPSTTTGPGEKAGEVTVKYPDGSKDTVNVTVNVRKLSDEYTPTGIPQEVDNGHVPDPETSVNKTGLPEGTTVTWKTTPDVSTPGSHPGVALVHYPDGTEDEVDVPVTVKEQKETFNPTAKEPNQTVRHNEVPDPAKSINTKGLPEGTTYTWSEQPNTSTPGSKPGKVLITYPDHSTEEVPVTVEVTPQKDEYTPTGIPQEVDNGHVPDPETSVNKTGLPEGTTVTWKTTPDVSTPGSHPGVALVHYPDGTEDEVDVPVTVKEQKETFNPTAKEPNQTVRHNEVPDPAKSINTNGLPEGTTYTWSEQPNTSTPGSKPGKVLITYPDKSTEEVPVTVEVTPQKDEYTPTAIPQTVDNGQVPKAEESVNKTGLPEGTTVTWKTTPEVSTPGSHPGVALVHYPDGTEDEVEVPIVVRHRNEKGIPEVQPTLPEFNGGANGNPEVKPALPEFSGGANGEPDVQSVLPEFNGGVNGEPEVQPALPEFAGGVNGESEVQPALPEFNGGVNGEPEIQSELPKYLGRVNNDSEIRSNFRDRTSNVVTKRLANTGQSQNNSELAGLGLAIVGLFAAIKRRKNEEE